MVTGIVLVLIMVWVWFVLKSKLVLEKEGLEQEERRKSVEEELHRTREQLRVERSKWNREKDSYTRVRPYKMPGIVLSSETPPLYKDHLVGTQKFCYEDHLVGYVPLFLYGWLGAKS